MALLDAERLLKPVSDTAPTGENLDNDGAFRSFERAVVGKPERQMGDLLVPAEPPDWGAVEQQAMDLLGRTKDLRILVQLVRALLQRGGYQGLAEGLGILKQMILQYWEPIHPQLDPDDGNDPMMRLNALGNLASVEFLGALRAAPLIRSRSFGSVSLRDISVASGETAPAAGATPLEMSAVEAAFQECDLDALRATVAAAKSALNELREIEQALTETFGISGPDFAGLVKLLRQADQTASRRLASREPVDAPAEDDGANGANGVNGVGESSVSRGGPMEIRSREDVVKALDKICAYYLRSEPSSPLPLLLERCKRLVTMTFLEIVKEMAPEGLPHVEIIAGKQGES